MPRSVLEKVAHSTLIRLVKEALDRVFPKKPKKPPSQEPSPQNPESPKSHPWRLCAIGEHWRKTHPRQVGASETNPDGSTQVRGHCVRNPSGKEVFHTEELQEIARLHFERLRSDPESMPSSNDLDFKYDGIKFDASIAGWTKFWNEVFKPKTPLDPDWVKALVASESGFRAKVDTPSKDGKAKGLIQVTENTRKIVGNAKGELRNHYIHIESEDLDDPEISLATGIRWLHHKKHLLEHRLKREATWEEAILEYKGLTNQAGEPEAEKITRKLKEYYSRLKRSRESQSL